MHGERLCNGVGHQEEESDDLKLDYFYQNESDEAALPRRFHRSAATLPVTPAVDAGDSRFSRKYAEQHGRRRQQMPPSYVEPFVRAAGHGFITARNDKELYTRSAGYLDEL